MPLSVGLSYRQRRRLALLNASDCGGRCGAFLEGLCTGAPIIVEINRKKDEK